MLASPVDGMAAEAETEIAGVASAAAIRTDKEQFVENVLAEASSSGAVNGGAATFGTIVGLAKGKHGTVLFLAWSPKLYFINRGKALRGSGQAGATRGLRQHGDDVCGRGARFGIGSGKSVHRTSRSGAGLGKKQREGSAPRSPFLSN